MGKKRKDKEPPIYTVVVENKTSCGDYLAYEPGETNKAPQYSGYSIETAKELRPGQVVRVREFFDTVHSRRRSFRLVED